MMSRPRCAWTALAGTPVLVIAALVLSFVATSGAAPSAKSAQPRVTTGAVSHARGNTVELEGRVMPNGRETTYFFQFGPTTKYGSQTRTASAGKGAAAVKVGLTATPMLLGYHFRLVATNSAGTTFGHDHTFTIKKGRLKFVLTKHKHQEPPTPYGGTYVLSGTLSGTGGTPHEISLQASPYPYKEAFETLGTSFTTSTKGAFVVSAKNLKKSTQLRLMTSSTRSVFGPVITAHVSPKVTLKVRTTSVKGLVRLYGTVTPASVGTRVLFQLVRSPSSERSENGEAQVHYSTQSRTTTKHGTRAVSRFSSIVTVQRSGHYRAYVLVHTGALVPGGSPSVTLHGAPSKKSTPHKGK